MNHRLMQRKLTSLMTVLLALGILCILAASCGGGTGAKRIADGCWPSWSPDGSKIAFLYSESEPQDTPRVVYFMDRDGSHRIAVSTTLPGDTAIQGISWSPDGQKIAFAYARCIYTMGVDGSNLTKVVGELSQLGSISATSWSPDGSKIAFDSKAWGRQGIWVVDVDGTNETELTPEAMDDRSPAWSPDGSKIAFASQRDGHWEIYVMNADGSHPTRLTNNTAYTYNDFPVWSPDGSRIAFTSDREGRWDIYIMNADGSNVTRLTDDSITKSSASWSPDGTEIVFWGYPKNDLHPMPLSHIYVVNVGG